jgi:hypothetical protein
LIADDTVAPAPPDLQRYARERDPAGLVDRAAAGVCTWVRERGAVELDAGKPLQATPSPEVGEVRVAPSEIRRSVERGGAGEQTGEACHEQQRFLAAHAGAERIDAVGVDSQPGQTGPHDRRHPGEVIDLSGVSP